MDIYSRELENVKNLYEMFGDDFDFQEYRIEINNRYPDSFDIFDYINNSKDIYNFPILSLEQLNDYKNFLLYNSASQKQFYYFALYINNENINKVLDTDYIIREVLLFLPHSVIINLKNFNEPIKNAFGDTVPSYDEWWIINKFDDILRNQRHVLNAYLIVENNFNYYKVYDKIFMINVNNLDYKIKYFVSDFAEALLTNNLPVINYIYDFVKDYFISNPKLYERILIDALYKAVEINNPNVVNYLLMINKYNINNLNKSLEIAGKKGNTNIIKLLIDNGAQIENNNYKTIKNSMYGNKHDAINYYSTFVEDNVMDKLYDETQYGSVLHDF